jgi:hypothetical protein
MTTLTKLRVYMFAGLLLSASATWAQALFGDLVDGYARGCQFVLYSKVGTKANGYSITRVAMAKACKPLGAATAGSAALVGYPAFIAFATTTTAKGGDAALANGDSFDTAILTPPSDWKGGNVSVTLKTSYKFSVKNSTRTRPGVVDITWSINDVHKHLVGTNTNGQGTLNVSFPFEIGPNHDGAYRFKVEVNGDAGAIAAGRNAASASVQTNGIKFVLPDKDWKCAWASNQGSCNE